MNSTGAVSKKVFLPQWGSFYFGFVFSPQHLANYASENLEAMNPPLFLRFLNLLMNDAIFLLDEAIEVRLTLF